MRFSAAVAVACLSMTALAATDPAQAAIRKSTNIAAQGLAPALRLLAKELDVQLVYRSDLVGNLQTSGAVGELTLEEALTNLLQGTGLTFKYLDDHGITIVAATERSAQVSSPATLSEHEAGETSSTSVWERFRLAQVAQGADSQSSAPGKSMTLEEVVVTATKRAQNIQDVPMSIAAISNQEIERRSLSGMEDYLRSIPGVNQIDTGARANAIVIRGVTTSPESENAASGAGATVSSYFDETPITAAAGYQSGGIDVRPVDIERIEILRGPQGTTYGSASLGGAVRMIPVKPKLDRFEAKVAASYSDTSGYGSDNSMVQGVVNIPLVQDKLAVRAVGYRFDESGTYRNVAGIDPATVASAEPFGLGDYVRGFTQNDVGRMVSTGGRLSAAWQATDKLNLSATFLTQTIEQDGLPSQDLGRYQQKRIPVPSQFRLHGETGEANDTDIDLLNLVLNYDLGWATLTSAVSRVESGSQNAQSIAVAPLFFTGGAESDFDSSTLEMRLVSQLQGRLQFLAGLYYEDLDESSVQITYWPGPLAQNPFGDANLGLIDVARQLEQHAAFGEISYEIIDRLTATVGGRFFKYEKDQSILREGALFGAPIGGGVPQNLDNSDDGSSFSASLSYKPTEGTLLYASWAEGFRLGRPAPGLPSTCDADNDGFADGSDISIESTRSIESDFLENYEIGGKFSLFDQRLAIDASVYHIVWDGLPTRTNAPPPCQLPYVANLGAATSDGAEFQARLSVVEGLRLDFGAGYTDAQLSEDALGLIPPAFDGDRLPGSPKWSANLAAQYDFNVAGYDAFVRADSFYTGKFYGDLRESPLTAAGDYTKIDARAGVAINALSVELFVRNLTNEDAFTWRGLSNFNSVFGYRLRPRTVGIQLGYRFE